MKKDWIEQLNCWAKHGSCLASQSVETLGLISGNGQSFGEKLLYIIVIIRVNVKIPAPGGKCSVVNHILDQRQSWLCPEFALQTPDWK